jgi:hypothetical protein
MAASSSLSLDPIHCSALRAAHFQRQTSGVCGTVSGDTGMEKPFKSFFLPLFFINASRSVADIFF